MKNVMHRLVGSVALLVFSIPTLCHAQQQPQILTLDKPIDLRLHKATLMLVLDMLSMENNIPIGIEFSANEKNEPKLDIDVKKAPLVEVLNLIVQQEPGYMWELRDGVINITPVQDRDPFFEKLLNTQVRSFVSPKGNNKFAIREALINLPEIKELIVANGVEADRFTYPHKPSIYANDADLSDKNKDFRSLLNKIIRESEHNSWLLQWVDKKPKTFELGF
jgi:hypothetical protein